MTTLDELQQSLNGAANSIESAITERDRLRAAIEAFKVAAKAEADSRYCEMADLSHRNECRGERAKMAEGKFGENELNAHRFASRLHGEYAGLHRAIKLMEELLK